MVDVTKPYLPPLGEFIPYLEKIWESGMLSNGGPFHQELEIAIGNYLGQDHVSLFCNATVALMVAQRSLGIVGEIITTPFSFVATSHAIMWAGNTPVFVDIDDESLCIDPEKIESAITPKTSAILPLHCFGNVCDIQAIRDIAERNNLKVLYDACHSFGTCDTGGSVLRHGDAAVVSFHATKVFNTLEGGLLVSSDSESKQRVDRLKNFGFVSETSVTEIGLNGKMQEVSAALGLVQLRHINEILDLRSRVDALYRTLLSNIDGIRCVAPRGQEVRNFSYFPIIVDDTFPISRDELYQRLKQIGVNSRRYFYPLISQFPMYTHLPSAQNGNLPLACRVSSSILCLPIYPTLSSETVHDIAGVICASAR